MRVAGALLARAREARELPPPVLDPDTSRARDQLGALAWMCLE